MNSLLYAVVLLAGITTGFYPIEELRPAIAPIPAMVLPSVLLLGAIFDRRTSIAETLSGGMVPIAASGILIVCYVISTFLVAPALGYHAAYSEPISLLYILLFVMCLFQSKELAATLARGVAIGVCIAVAYGFYRFLFNVGGLDSERALGYWGIRYLPATRNSDVLYPLLGFALFIISGVGAKSAVIRTFWGIPIVILLSAIVLSFSRGAWIAALIALLFAGWLFFDRIKSVALFLALTVAGIVLVIPLMDQIVARFDLDVISGLLPRLLSIFDDAADVNVSNDIRGDIIVRSLGSAFDFPLGVGAGGFRYFINDPDLGNAENAALTILGEAGIIGFASIATLFAWLFVQCRSALRGANLMAQDRIPDKYYAAAITISLLAYLQFNHEMNGLVPWLVLGLSTRLFLTGQSSQHTAIQPVSILAS